MAGEGAREGGVHPGGGGGCQEGALRLSLSLTEVQRELAEGLS